MPDVAGPPEPAKPSKSFLAKWWLPLTLAVFVLVGIAAAFAAGGDGDDSAEGRSEGSSLSELETAKNICAAGRPEGVTYIVLGDEGSTLTMRGEGDAYHPGASLDDIVCVLVMLDMPDSVASQIDRTTSMMGVQQAAWDDFEASWSYHPDNGLNMIVEQVP
jgi:hypothetical protein